ncbi:Alpha/Beta hydrolase protein [Aspergillus venezuelensis]
MKSLHAWLWLIAGLGCSHAISTIVDLGYSKYQGTALPSGVSQFLGMRYADPPVGDWRWRAPRNASLRSGIQHADHFPPICVGLGQTTSLNTTEDCLFVNVFTPSNAAIDSNLPVWVYIQGGGFVTNANANYNGSSLVIQSNHSIILVNFNYRVGPLGFLASEEVRADGDLNVGLLDQRKLLHWVQKHIHLFGGNPRHVVIHGASAGGTSVTHHLTAYNGRDDNLFVGAIGESLAWTRSLTINQSEKHFESLASRLNCSALDRMSCLRSLDASTIQTLGHAPQDDVLALSTQLLYQPVIDGDIFTAPHYSLFQQGRFLDFPLILGYDTNEGSLFAPNASTKNEVASFVQGWSPQLNSPEIENLVYLYPPEETIPGRARYFPAASEIFADGVFLCPTNWIARSANSDQPVWNYRYNVLDHIALGAGLGVPHTFETEAIFGPGQAESIRAGFLGAGSSYSTYNAAIVEVIQNYFISFVKSLDPNTLRSPSSPEWKRFNLEEGRLKIQTNQTVMEGIPSDLLDKCNTWYSYEDSIVQE